MDSDSDSTSTTSTSTKSETTHSSASTASRDDKTLEIERRNQILVLIAILISQVTCLYKTTFFPPRTIPIPYHTSALTGQAWVLELMTGHLDRIKHNLGVRLHVFKRLLQVLRNNGIQDSRNGVIVEEQAAIFLYGCVTGLSTNHLGERFQRSPTTISRYFKRVLFFLSSNPFYSSQVRFPNNDTPISPIIDNDPRFRFFSQCIGAVDGTHIRAFASLEDQQYMRNRKGFLSQNCLFICDFEFFFTYALCGWEGSAADAAIWNDARRRDLRLPQGKYLLADAGFGTCDALLVPYRGVRYHLKEWRQANLLPQNPRELFNLRHAALRNVIERIFGVMKRRWRVLQAPVEYSMQVQAHIPVALCALHNFIQRNDPDHFEEAFDGQLFDEDEDVARGELGDGPADAAERRRAEERRDNIARQMWDDYLAERAHRGLPPP